METAARTYPIDPENAIEMARLLNQDTMTTNAMGGPLSEQGKEPVFHNVLDLACGPGGWVLDVARMLPEARVTGTDVSARMTNYGQATANARGLHNARFTTMNIQEPFPFEDNSFDLINARYLVAVLTPDVWPAMLRETFRVCEPGGIMRLTEFEAAITSSPAFEQIIQMGLEVFHKTNRIFSPNARNFGITPILSRLLTNVGYRNIQRKAYAMDSSAGTAGHESFYQDYMVALSLVKPFLVGLGSISAEQYEELYQQALHEMMSSDFCAITYSLTVWGQKPKP